MDEYFGGGSTSTVPLGYPELSEEEEMASKLTNPEAALNAIRRRIILEQEAADALLASAEDEAEPDN